MSATEIIAICFFAGGFAGILSGLLGLGGGLTTVPILTYVLPFASVPSARVMHSALATSLTLMIMNTGAAALTRYRHGHLSPSLFRQLAAPVALGACVGVAVADQVSGFYLRLFFLAFVLYAMARTVFHLRVNPTAELHSHKSASLPGYLVTVPYALLTGFIGALAGGGAATLMVPFLGQSGFGMQTGAAQAAALSFVIGLFGAASYAVAGFDVTAMPDWSLGYIYLPALGGLMTGGFLGVPVGVRLAKRMDDRTLRIGFLIFLAIVLVTMLSGL